MFELAGSTAASAGVRTATDTASGLFSLASVATRNSGVKDQVLVKWEFWPSLLGWSGPPLGGACKSSSFSPKNVSLRRFV